MLELLKTLRAAADPTRLRILLLLQAEELSVAELQEILTLGQSNISSQLQQLRAAGLVEDRRAGKSSLYQLTRAAKKPEGLLAGLLAQAGKETPESGADRTAMRRIVKKREERMRAFFDAMAGRLGKDYVPGKSWKSTAEGLLRVMPRFTVADVGAGDGGFALFLSQRAKEVIAVDSSAKMLEVGRKEAKRRGIHNVSFRQGDFENLPIEPSAVDLLVFSQSLHHAIHPDQALAQAHKVLAKGGRVLILDLARHRFEEARELYADQRLGFGEAELEEMLTEAGFTHIEIQIVDRDPETPQFQTLLAVADKR
ncbi:MAG TPA: metalloregulator ArsR/SmtB family transcription factor [Terracidiphilus sp.]|jgi:ArsR family transcriptional regulator|nr:metalloregulator ArsR/SmtB family transcription factor [Terracidiphilus sp.]